jgi:hypothetical protein
MIELVFWTNEALETKQLRELVVELVKIHSVYTYTINFDQFQGCIPAFTTLSKRKPCHYG